MIDKIIIDGLSFALPLFIMAIGGIYSERSGITNLALEGLQGAGAFVGALVAVFLMQSMGTTSQVPYYAAMLFAIYNFLLVVTRQAYQKWLKITVVTLFIGGFMLGPLMQHVAFGPWWTGFPFGTDLTDNKTLISFLFFLGALASMRWKHNRWAVALAVLIMVVIFSIPHSTNGSEYDYKTQTIGTEK